MRVFGPRNVPFSPMPERMVNSGSALCVARLSVPVDRFGKPSQHQVARACYYAFSPSGFTNCNEAEFMQ